MINPVLDHKTFELSLHVIKADRGSSQRYRMVETKLEGHDSSPPKVLLIRMRRHKEVDEPSGQLAVKFAILISSKKYDHFASLHVTHRSFTLSKEDQNIRK